MKKFSLIKWVFSFAKTYKPKLILSIICSVVSAVAAVYLPLMVGDCIDAITGAGAGTSVKDILTLIALLVALRFVSSFAMNLINNNISFSIVRDIRRKAFESTLDISMTDFAKYPGGDIVSRIINDTDNLTDGLVTGFTQLFSDLVTIAATLIFMFSINIKSAVTVVVLTPLSLFAARFISKNSFSMFRKQSEQKGRLTGFVDEHVNAQNIVKAFSGEKRAEKEFYEIGREYSEYSKKAIFFSSLTNPVTRFVNNTIYAFVALIGALDALKGLITVGRLTCFLSYAGQYAKPFNEISDVIAGIQSALSSTQRVKELIEIPPEGKETVSASHNCTDKPSKGEIEIKDLGFSYDGKTEVLKDINLTVKPGEHIAITGETGCGKTTLLNLLLRFYEPARGEIRIDGVNIKRLDLSELRSQFGVVLQDIFVKEGTVRENLKFGNENATDDEMIKCAKLCHAHSFIKRLPLGYDTVISDSCGLSLGQKQLLCIARVMLQNPGIVILDEATSQLDTRTEAKVLSALDTLMKGKTAFVVAHRLSTVKNADIVFDLSQNTITVK